MKIVRRLLLVLVVVLGVLFALGLGLSAFGWPTATHPTTRSELGAPSSASALEAVIEVPGPLSVETVVGADWVIERSGLIDLTHPAARALTDGDEPIQVYLHALRHPRFGLFVIDTGVERALVTGPDAAAIRGFIASAGGVDRMVVRTDTATWLAAAGAPVEGILLTHLHLDHISGLRDFPAEVPVYSGPGEASSRSAFAFATQASVDRALEGHPPLREWSFEVDPDHVFEGVIDVFGDGSLWALSVPGHTRGSTAYVARTPEGPVLFTGDVSHTAWGWSHDVPPGTFTEDHDANVASLAALRGLVARHPGIDVRLGHQPLD